MREMPHKPGASSKRDGASQSSSSAISPPAFLEQVAATIAAHQMVLPGETVLVAASGGPDSSALLHALVQLRPRLRCRLRACHVHHGLRGADADADALQARALAASFGVPFTQRRADVRSFAQKHALSLETAARAVRYHLLERAADRAGAARIATGHTADDQAETVLLNLIRGAGPAGLAGIPAVRANIIRPLLQVTRADVEAYCRAQSIPHRLDQSNLDLTFTRNRVRHEILPALQNLQPRAVASLCRLADIMRAENDFIAEQASHTLREIGVQRPGEVGLTCGPFAMLSKAMQRRVLRAAVAKLKGDELDLELERVDAMVSLAISGHAGGVVELPGGLRAERTYGELVIAPAAPERDMAISHWTLPVPGQVSMPELRLQITAAYSRARRPPPSPMQVLVDAGTVTPPLTVRTRRRGDRFTPLGMKQSVKLQDFFVNSKVPRPEREQLPLVLSGDEIIWVVGHRINDHFKVRENTRRTIRLEAHRLSQS